MKIKGWRKSFRKLKLNFMNEQTRNKIMLWTSHIMKCDSEGRERECEWETEKGREREEKATHARLNRTPRYKWKGNYKREREKEKKKPEHLFFDCRECQFERQLTTDNNNTTRPRLTFSFSFSIIFFPSSFSRVTRKSQTRFQFPFLSFPSPPLQKKFVYFISSTPFIIEK